jgi:hypothetical protein
MYFSLEKSISSPTDLWRYIGNHPEKFNHSMRREMRAGLEEDSDGAGARRFFRSLRGKYPSLAQIVFVYF